VKAATRLPAVLPAGTIHSLLMAAETSDEVKAVAVRHIIGRPVGDQDISPLLTPAGRKTLGLPEEGPYSLSGLAWALISQTAEEAAS
jgi:hypothetical protein